MLSKLLFSSMIIFLLIDMDINLEAQGKKISPKKKTNQNTTKKKQKVKKRT